MWVDVKNPAGLRKINGPCGGNSNVLHLMRLARRVPKIE
jgi:hypothetical protein